MVKSRKSYFIKQRPFFELEIVSKKKNKVSQDKYNMGSKGSFRLLFPTGVKAQTDASMKSGRTSTASQGLRVTVCFLNYVARTLFVCQF